VIKSLFELLEYYHRTQTNSARNLKIQSASGIFLKVMVMMPLCDFTE